MTQVDFTAFTADDLQTALMPWKQGSAATSLTALEGIL